MEIIEVQYQPVTVEVAGSGGHQAWDAYVRTRENANPYHLYAWNAIFREPFGCETCYLVAKADAKIKGVLPLFIIKNPVLGSNYISSLRGGVCADDVDAAQQLIQERSNMRMCWLICRLIQTQSGKRPKQEDLDGRFVSRFVRRAGRACRSLGAMRTSMAFTVCTRPPCVIWVRQRCPGAFLRKS